MPVSNRPSPKVIDNQMTSLELIQLLLDKGANVNAQLKKQQPYRTKLDRGDDTMLTAGTTPLLRAAKAADSRPCACCWQGRRSEARHELGSRPLT